MKILILSRRVLSVCVAAILFAGCGGSQSPIGAPGALPQTAVHASWAAPLALKSCATAACIYVANCCSSGPGSSITVFPANATGNVKPYRTIAGEKTGLTFPTGVAVGARGSVYVTQGANNNSILVFDATANGDVRPRRTIEGRATRLHSPSSLALADGNIYASNSHTDGCNFNVCLAREDVTEYPADSRGNVAPTRVIRGDKAGKLVMDGNIAVDGKGNVYVGNYRACSQTFSGFKCVGKNAIFVYEPGAHGRSAPSWMISGSKTRIRHPSGDVAVDGAGNVYVSDCDGLRNRFIGSVYVYAAGEHGNIAPIQAISGSKTRLHCAEAIAVDTARNIYVLNEGVNSYSITVYAAGATGDVAPIQIIEGPNTGFTLPNGIAVH